MIIIILFFLIFNFSKKPQDARWAELRAAISPHLISLISEKVIEWACEKPLAPLVIETARSAIGDVTPIYSKLINEGLMRPLCISDTDHRINDSDQMITDSDQHHLISDPCGHWVLKKLLTVHREGKEEMVFHFNFYLSSSHSLFLHLSPTLPLSPDTTALFSDMIIQAVPTDSIVTWSTINRGCFVLSR